MIVKTTERPLRGWNSYDAYGVYINEQQAIANIDAFGEKLFPAGYEYFVLDACWYSDGSFMDTYNLRKEGRDRRSHIDFWGRFIESPELFPRGLRFLADRCHRRGFKFGVHLMRGLPRLAIEWNTPVKGASGVFARDIADFSTPCAWPAPYMGAGIKPGVRGAQEYYDSVVEYLAEVVQVDFIKFDDVQQHYEDIRMLASAIGRVKRPIVLSISPGQETFAADWPIFEKYCNMVRITCDIWDGECAHVNEKFMRMEQFEMLSNPKCWADLDMIPIGGIQVHVPEDTPEECWPVWGHRRKSYNSEMDNRVLMTQIALMKSPLFYGGDLPMSDDRDIGFVTNPDMLDCNADGAGCKCIFRRNYADVRKSVSSTRPNRGWIGIFNKCCQKLTFTFTPEDLGFDGEMPSFHDVWEGTPVPQESGRLTVDVAGGGCVFLKYCLGGIHANPAFPQDYMEPFRIYGGFYHIGTAGLPCYLIDTGDGILLLDTAGPNCLEALLLNMRKIGYGPEQIKWILHSHGHYDHFGCTKALAAISHAKTYIGAPDVPTVEGRDNLSWFREAGIDGAPYFFTPDVPVHDGDTLQFGPLSVKCVSTPGHTRGVFSYFFHIAENGIPLRCGTHGGVGFNTLSKKYLRENGLPCDTQQIFLDGLAKVEDERVDICVGNHLKWVNGVEKARRRWGNPDDPDIFVDATEWKRFINTIRTNFNEFLRKESEAPEK